MASKSESSFSRKVTAEFVGTAALVVCGPGTAAATTVLARSSGVAFSMAQLGVIAVITTAGPVTGAALNPARYLGPMIAKAALGAGHDLPWHQAPTYLTATFTAGLLAAATYTLLARVAGSGLSRAVVRRSAPAK